MPRTLYSPRLSDDVVRSLYREARRRGLPMTRLADELIRSSLAQAETPANLTFDPPGDGPQDNRASAA